MQEVSYVKPAVQQLFNFYLLDAYLRKFDRTLSGVMPLELDDNHKPCQRLCGKKTRKGLWKISSLHACLCLRMATGTQVTNNRAIQGLLPLAGKNKLRPCRSLAALSVHRPLTLELFDEQTKKDILQAKLPRSLKQRFQWNLHDRLREFMEQKRKRFQLPQQIENLYRWLKDLGFGPDFLFFTDCDADLQGVEDKLQAIVLTCMLGQYGVLLEPGSKA